MTKAYIQGFCKTAEAHGVDPQELMKTAAGLSLAKNTIARLRKALSPYGPHKFKQNGLLTPGIDMGKQWLNLTGKGQASVAGGLAERAVSDIVNNGKLVSGIPGLRDQLISLLKAQQKSRFM